MRETNLHKSADIISFDVFDTAITRLFADPTGVFYDVADKCVHAGLTLPVNFIRQFRELRIDAEHSVRKKVSAGEVTLDDIYEEFALRNQLSTELAERIKKYEIQSEIAAVRPVPAIASLAKAYRSQGKRIVFISDMYLPAIVIQSMLDKVGIFVPGDGLYVSNEYGVSKWSGGLYKLVAAKEGVEPGKICHHGDNYRVDVLMARRAGFQARYYDTCRLSRYEKILLQNGNTYGLQVTAGAARLARLKGHEIEEIHYAALHGLGANIAGPLFAAFVAWVLREAVRDGIRRLYFVSRDGQVLLELARSLVRQEGYPLDVRYLYGSRQAWNLAALHELNDQDLEWILVANPVLTIRILAVRLGLSEKRLVELINDKFSQQIDVDKPLDKRQILIIAELLRHDSDIRNLVQINAGSAGELCRKYLAQEGLIDNVPMAMVDVGWQCTSQRALQRLLSDNGQAAITGYYLGVTKQNENNSKSFYFSSESSKQLLDTGFACIPIIEILATSDHGGVTGYSQNDDKYLPILRKLVHNPSTWGLEYLRDGIMAFAETWFTYMDSDVSHMVPAYPKLMKQLFHNPSRSEAEALGSCYFTSDQTECIVQEAAPKFSLVDAVQFLSKFPCSGKPVLTHWIPGTIARSSMIVRMLLTVSRGIYRFYRIITPSVRKGCHS